LTSRPSTHILVLVAEPKSPQFLMKLPRLRMLPCHRSLQKLSNNRHCSGRDATPVIHYLPTRIISCRVRFWAVLLLPLLPVGDNTFTQRRYPTRFLPATGRQVLRAETSIIDSCADSIFWVERKHVVLEGQSSGAYSRLGRCFVCYVLSYFVRTGLSNWSRPF
jgi:hypothetical protein